MKVDGEEETQDLLRDRADWAGRNNFCYTKNLGCRVDDQTVKRLKDEGASEETIRKLLVYSRNSFNAAGLIQSHCRRWSLYRPYHRTRQAVIVLQRWGRSRNPLYRTIFHPVTTLQSLQRSRTAKINAGYLRDGICNFSHVLTIQTGVRRYLSLPIVHARNIARKVSFHELTDRYAHTTKWRLGKKGYTWGEETNEVVDMSTRRPCSYVQHFHHKDGMLDT